jgi:D-glycero-D-manno-heptose 1,7-bisphosphate phosphatase
MDPRPNRLVILDRDGVINHDSDSYIKKPEEWRPIAGSIEAIADLSHAGYRVAVATNQSGVGRGLFDMATLNAINDKMMELVFRHGGRIDAVFFCPHTNEDRCDCRKPKPGMFREIATRFHIDLQGVPVVGDSLRDLEAGVALGCKPYLVMTGKGAKTLKAGGLPDGTRVCDDLARAVQMIIAAPAEKAP